MSPAPLTRSLPQIAPGLSLQTGLEKATRLGTGLGSSPRPVHYPWAAIQSIQLHRAILLGPWGTLSESSIKAGKGWVHRAWGSLSGRSRGNWVWALPSMIGWRLFFPFASWCTPLMLPSLPPVVLGQRSTVVPYLGQGTQGIIPESPELLGPSMSQK